MRFLIYCLCAFVLFVYGQNIVSAITSSLIYDHRFPAVAFSKNNYLVVWEGCRNEHGTWTPSQIYGTRITLEGIILDSLGIDFNFSNRTQKSPCVAFDGKNYFVVWQEYFKDTGYDIYGKRISPSGYALDSSPIAICTALGDQKSPSITFVDSTYLVVWMDDRAETNSAIYGARILTSGILLDTMGVNLSGYSCWAEFPSCASIGSDFFVVWTEFHNSSSWDIYGRRLNHSGVVLDSIPLPICVAKHRQRNPAIASTGDEYYVVWHDWRNGRDYDIYGSVVNNRGKVLNPEGSPICKKTLSQYAPRAVFDGINFIIVWVDWNHAKTYPNIYSNQINKKGEVISKFSKCIFPSNCAQYSPQICYNGKDYFIVWFSSVTTNTFEICGGRFCKNKSANSQLLHISTTIINSRFV